MTIPLSAAPDRLRLLADWFDATHYSPDTEVQEDLRHWADLIEKLVGGIVDTAITEQERLVAASAALAEAEGCEHGYGWRGNCPNCDPDGRF